MNLPEGERKKKTNVAMNLRASYNYTLSSVVSTTHSMGCGLLFLFFAKIRSSSSVNVTQTILASLLFFFEF